MFPFTPHTIMRLDWFWAFFYGGSGDWERIRRLSIFVLLIGIIQLIDRFLGAFIGINFAIAIWKKVDKYLVDGLAATEASALKGLRQKLVAAANKYQPNGENDGSEYLEGTHSDRHL